MIQENINPTITPAIVNHTGIKNDRSKMPTGLQRKAFRLRMHVLGIKNQQLMKQNINRRRKCLRAHHTNSYKVDHYLGKTY